jgi:hypothetical protein
MGSLLNSYAIIKRLSGLAYELDFFQFRYA